MSDSKKKAYGFSFLRRALRRGNTLLLGSGSSTLTITEEQLQPFGEGGKPNPKALSKEDRLNVVIVPIEPKGEPALTREEADALWQETVQSKEAPNVG